MAWIGFSLFLFLSSPLAPSISVRHVFFYFNNNELFVSRVFYVLTLLKLFVWVKGMTLVSSLSLLVHLASLPALKAVSLFTYRCSSNASNHGAGAAFFDVNGVPMGTLVKSLVTLFVSLLIFYRH